METKKTCIVIDDDRTFLMLMKALIRKIDWINLVGEYDNPIKGATAVLADKPDIVITDYRMPYMTGTDLIEWLNPQFLNLPNPPKMLVISGNDEEDCDNLYLANGFLCKKELSKKNNLEEVLSNLFQEVN